MKHKGPRSVAVALVFCPATHRVLLITSRKHPNLWIFPKGGVETGESTAEAAVREAHEEAGITIPVMDVSPPLMEEHTMEGSRPAVWTTHCVSLASEKSLDSQWLEQGQRERRWMSPRDALVAIREWGGLIGQGGYEGDEDDEESMKRGGPKKKAIKGDAFELGLTAFARIYGWEKRTV